MDCRPLVSREGFSSGSKKSFVVVLWWNRKMLSLPTKYTVGLDEIDISIDVDNKGIIMISLTESRCTFKLQQSSPC